MLLGGLFEGIPLLEAKTKKALDEFMLDVEKEAMQETLGVRVYTHSGFKYSYHGLHSLYVMEVPRGIKFTVWVDWEDRDKNIKNIHCFTSLGDNSGLYCYELTEEQAVQYVKVMYRFSERFMLTKFSKEFEEFLKEKQKITFDTVKEIQEKLDCEVEC